MNRLWLRSLMLLFGVAQFVAASVHVHAADETQAEKLLPKETLVFFTVTDVPDFKEQWDKTSVGQMLHDPQLQPFLDDVKKKIEVASKKLEEEFGVSISDLTNLPQGELTFALLPVPPGKLSAVLGIEYVESQATVDRLLKKLDEALEKAGSEHSTEDFEEVTIHVYKLKNDDPNFPVKTIAYFTDEKNFVISTDVAALHEVIERWNGDSEDSLAQNEQFKYIHQQCKSERDNSLVKWYISPIGLIQSGITMAQQTFPQAGMAAGFLPMLGIDGLKGWGGSMDFNDGEFEGVASAFMYLENSRGLMGVFSFPAIALLPPKWVPASVGSYVSLNWNISSAYTAVETLYDSLQGRGAMARILDGVADQGPMIHPKKDLIDQLDGKIHFLQGEPKEAVADAPAAPPVFFGLGLKDPAKMKKILSATAKAGGANLETRDFNGETIYEVGASEGGMSIAVTEGQLVFTNDTPLLEGIMRGQSGQVAALVDSADYKKIAKFFPAKLSMLSFQNSDMQLKTVYNMLKTADSDNDLLEGIDLKKLPPFEVFAKYLQPSGGYTVPDKKGSKSVNFSLKSTK